MRFRTKVLFLFAALAAVAGGSLSDAHSAENGPERIEWLLAEIGGAPAASMTGHEQPSLVLDPAQKKASGFTGCNGFFARYVLERDTLKFGPIGSTRRACPDQESALEAKFLGALGRTRAWKVQDGMLLLVDGSGTLVRFTARTGAGAAADPGSMTYRSGLFPAGTVTLAGGRFRAPAAPGSASEITVALSDMRIFGWVRAREAGAVVLAVSTGGTGTFMELALLLKGAKGWENSDTISLGYRVIVRSIGFSDDHLVVDMAVHGPGDPLCCPTVEVKRRYAIQGDRLVPAVE